MKKLLLFALAALPATAADVLWNFQDFTGGNMAVRQVTIQTIARYGINTNTPAIITGDLKSYRTTSSTSLTVSNLLVGRSYRVSFYGPLTPWGTNAVTVFTNNFAADVSGYVNAADYLNVPTQTDSNASAYSQSSADARFHNVSGDTSTNATFRGTLTMPATGVSGYVWTATNSTGAGFWQAGGVSFIDSSTVTHTTVGGSNQFAVVGSALTGIPQSGVSGLPAALAAKADTNAPTLFSPVFQGHNIVLVSGNVQRPYATLALANAAATAGDTILVYGSNYLSAPVAIAGGVTVRGAGPASVLASTGQTSPTIIVTNSGVTLESLRIISDRNALGGLTEAPMTVTNLIFANLNIYSATNAVLWKPSSGTGSNVVQATFWNCNIRTATNASNGGIGIWLHLATNSLVKLFNCDVFGDVDGILAGSYPGGRVEIFGGLYVSTLDAITSGGGDVYVNGAKARGGAGGNGDLFQDDGTLTVLWTDYETIDDGVVGNHRIPGSLLVEGSITNALLTDAVVWADVNGKFGEATAANIAGLWTGSGTYMTRFGTNANAGSGETNLQRVLQVGSDAAGQNATNFGTISATNAAFENLEIENQYVTNHYVTSLTSGRVVFSTTGGQLTDHSGLTYNSGTGNMGVQGSVTAESFAGDGSALTDLNATEISSGTLANARLDADLQTWAGISLTNSAASNKWLRATSASTAEFTELPASSGDVTAAGNNNFTGSNNFGGGFTVGGYFVPLVLTNYGTPTGVTNSTTETTIATVTIPSNLLRSNSAVDLQVDAALFNQSGAGHSPFFRVYVGGTMAFADIAPSYSSQTVRRPIRWNLTLGCNNSLVSQWVFGTFSESGTGSVNVGEGDITAAPTTATRTIRSIALALGTDTNLTFSLTVSNQTTDANIASYALHTTATLKP